MCSMAGVLGLGGVLLALSSYTVAARGFSPWTELFGERFEEAVAAGGAAGHSEATAPGWRPAT
jgi:hypothetical protein